MFDEVYFILKTNKFKKFVRKNGAKMIKTVKVKRNNQTKVRIPRFED